MQYPLFNKIIKVGKTNFEEPNTLDRYQEKIFLWIFPGFIKPNHLTLFRYLTIPPVILLLEYNLYAIALPLFLISVATDAFDGAMARTRKQITSWGKMHDPLADKLLIGTVGFILITKYIGIEIILIILFLELLTIVAALSLYDPEDNPGARLPGKVKMFSQSLGLILLLVFAITGNFVTLFLSMALFYISILFSVLNVLFCTFFAKSL